MTSVGNKRQVGVGAITYAPNTATVVSTRASTATPGLGPVRATVVASQAMGVIVIRFAPSTAIAVRTNKPSVTLLPAAPTIAPAKTDSAAARIPTVPKRSAGPGQKRGSHAVAL